MTPAPRHASALFISDLHLTPERPEGAAWFRAFLTGPARDAEALFILGDFFELWVGDDQLGDPFHQGLAAELRALADRGCRLYFLSGNRDFLAGERLAQATGWTRLADPVVVHVAGCAALLSHGDLLCTDDADYQAERARYHDPAWQARFLTQPLAERLAFARTLRARSESYKAGQRPEIMDVNPDAVITLMQNQGVTRLIHGHTHRPARHALDLAAGPGERWVLPDWYEGGGYLACDETGCRALTLETPIPSRLQP